MAKKGPITDILDILEARIATGPVDGRGLFDALDAAGLVPALMLPALLIVSPLSAIPLFSSFCGLIIVFIALQGAAGRKHPWLPGWLLDRHLPTQRTKNAVSVLRRLTSWLDRVAHQRLSLLVGGPMSRLLYLICACAAACIPFLELLPMSSSTIGAGVTLISVGILTRDGIFAVLGLICFGLASLIPLFVVTQVAALAA
ncbi:exopolysaccharide biosynthesis protein [Cognatiyoonia sp. IB215446]|uniref:exopolysaccharide biosynthesis protein n=1 Tax=Cognatiyoonia sp. IB215446 TaxID=3097355 RepID=UPI002A0CA24E|nr:exopolysaccharide biosynthesis protein [Cognatiyoonia sp. IB215446]MDX8349595.1 exopolysaccharide biosynthesis protein [Cognatiyoonia sp. IB215446]